ncbi:hypothetical protein J3R74_000686 [Puniceicoccus vermicola]
MVTSVLAKACIHDLAFLTDPIIPPFGLKESPTLSRNEQITRFDEKLDTISRLNPLTQPGS